MLWLIGGVVLIVLAWSYMNHQYRLVHGRALRWPYFWAAHGAVLFHRRFPNWERP